MNNSDVLDLEDLMPLKLIEPCQMMFQTLKLSIYLIVSYLIGNRLSVRFVDELFIANAMILHV